MLPFSPELKIYSHAEPIDIRKRFDGLFGIIKSDPKLDVRNGGLFMFLNLRRNRIKLMYWDRNGLAIWMKRLEGLRGQPRPRAFGRRTSKSWGKREVPPFGGSPDRQR
jgi:transposase